MAGKANSKTKRVQVRKCELCGRPLPPQSGRGRPRVYHPKCKRVADLMGWLVKEVEGIDFAPSHAQSLRSDLFALANDVRQRVDHQARKEAGDKLAQRRKDAGLSREELAEASGVKLHRVGHIETGKRDPSEEELAAIETVLRGHDSTSNNAS